MKNKIIFIFVFAVLVSASIYEAKAQDEAKYFPEVVKKNGKYEFYVSNGKNKFLIKEDTFKEELYYATRKIPADIKVNINSYNNKELIATWTEDNVIAEGETGGESEVSKFVKVINIQNGNQVFQYRYYFEKSGWAYKTVEGNNADEERDEYKDVIEDLSFSFKENLIVLTDNKIRKIIRFRYTPRKGYVKD